MNLCLKIIVNYLQLTIFSKNKFKTLHTTASQNEKYGLLHATY